MDDARTWYNRRTGEVIHLVETTDDKVVYIDEAGIIATASKVLFGLKYVCDDDGAKRPRSLKTHDNITTALVTAQDAKGPCATAAEHAQVAQDVQDVIDAEVVQVVRTLETSGRVFVNRFSVVSGGGAPEK